MRQPGKGIPRHADSTRPLDAFDVLVIGAVETLTNRIRRGLPLSASTCDGLERLFHRVEALKSAYEARSALVDDEDPEPVMDNGGVSYSIRRK